MSDIRESRPLHVALVLGVCVLVFWVRLGSSGLASSEGFRVIPAWEMLESGDWLVTRLFDQPYLRKPPGIVWAIAASSSILGRTEFAARFVSAAAVTLACLFTLAVGDRWFGRPRGLCAALAFALTPCFWMPGRSAEIEGLHNLWVLLSGVALVELSIGRAGRSSGKAGLLVAAAGVCIGGTLLTKGPAAVPFFAGVLAGACVSTRSIRPAARAGVWAAGFIGAALFFVWYRSLQVRVDSLNIEPVTETARFLWRPGKVAAVLLLAPTALASALPWSLALPFSLLRRDQSAELDRPEILGQATGWGLCIGLVAYTVLGIDNARYAMPALTFVPLVYAHALWRHTRARGAIRNWGRRLLLGSPAIPIIGLACLAAGYAQWHENRRGARHSGRHAGLALAAALPPNASVVADELIDTRPEVLWYARQAARRRGGDLHVRWAPGLAGQPWTARPDEFAAFRTDQGSRLNREPEYDILQGRVERIPPAFYSGTVHVFEFEVFEPGSFAQPPAGGT